MMLDVIGVCRDAWRTWRRDRALLLPIAGLFFFLPALLVGLLVPKAPSVAIDASMSEADRMEAVRPLAEWMVANAHWYLGATLMTWFGVLTMLTLYLGPSGLTVGGALRGAVRALPRYLVAMILIGVPAGLGYLTMILLLPALYLLGRLFLVGAVLVAEPPPAIGRSFSRSFALTRGNGFALAGVTTLLLLVGLISVPLDRGVLWMSAAHATNPVAVLLLEAVVAATHAVQFTAMALLQVAIYRSLLRRSGI